MVPRVKALDEYLKQIDSDPFFVSMTKKVA